ncbi:guanylate kinase [Candidatus Gracilibacteria bacterium]|nr:guanylate kinase [Candidatus Gracilibacteria bacterium]
MKTVFILSGPAGVGKNTVWNLVKEECTLSIEESTSMTSRNMRPGENNGVEYHFVTREVFEKKIHEGAFLEYALVHTNYYGSPKSELTRITKEGKSPIYIIEPQGMIHLKPLLEDEGYKVITIFLLPPSLEELKKRLKGRGTETQEEFEIRLATAITELEQQELYDIKIINTNLSDTKEELLKILTHS